MIFWGTQREYLVAFDDLLFMNLGGHCHYYFQEGELELSLITLAAKSDCIGGNLFSFQIRKSLQCATHCIVLQGLV